MIEFIQLDPPADIHYTTVGSPIGELLLAGHGDVLVGLYMTDQSYRPPIGETWVEDCEALPVVRKQLEEYFAGDRTEFDLTLAVTGTPFQVDVWQELAQVPYGETLSYGELADAVGKPRASRAVGSANGRNRVAVIIPCHRVIAGDGTLGGYGGGLWRKRVLLDLEMGGSAPDLLSAH